jgi:hypothetical protein
VHDGRTANEVLLAAMTKPAPPLASVVPGVSPAVAHVVDRALAFERDKRWPDAARMQEAVRNAYHDRNGVPMGTAPRLTVPESVPNRTLPSADGAIAPRLPTTGQPVSNSRGNPAVVATQPTFSRGAIVALVLGGAATIGVILAVVAVVALQGGSLKVSSAQQAASAPPAMTSAAVASAVPSASSAPPELAATDLPSVSSAPTPKPVAPQQLKPAAPAAAPTSTANCNPPYTTDSHGIRHPKDGCD